MSEAHKPEHPADFDPAVRRPNLRGHLTIMRVDHWVKNVFVLPGIIVALAAVPERLGASLLIDILLGLFATCLVASSNYVLNEILDAPFDLEHPVKRERPVPSGQVHIPLGYAEWLVLMFAGVGIAWSVSPWLALTLFGLWIMGLVYNVRPLRTKEIPYLDVVSEAVNNPLRMLAGWTIVAPDVVPPLSLLLSYWMVGAYFMAIKRYAELRSIGDREQAARYRRSFAHYTEERLLVSIMFYSAASMLFLGAFTIRYRFELILAFPLVALVMALYLNIGLRENSAAAAPENLHREPALMAAVIFCAVVIGALLWIDLPRLEAFFQPGATF